ncbi:flagellar type III secretion system pore protein FliP [Angustibacter sp. McL0619]|uniref:flagellar type III secretion system pore protein FliP n=1 Tax=Angustibacter sp. McL0619 TaxID=3415676 RepID=UPI003CF158FB
MRATRALGVGVLLVLGTLFGLALAAPASAAPAQARTAAVVAAASSSVHADPKAPTNPTAPSSGGVSIQIGGTGTDGNKPSSSIVIILAITALSVAPALLLLTTSFTKIFVVLGLTRNALGLQSTPPTQVLAGLALFLTLFVMSPVLTRVNETGIQPYLKGDLTATQAFEAGSKPLKAFMVKHTRPEELALMTSAANQPKPKNAASVPLSTLVPAFALSELRSAFLIGFLVFVPFLVIDLVVSAALMSLGMMMLPPVTVSLPFKLLLFVLVDGWGLIVHALVTSYR